MEGKWLAYETHCIRKDLQCDYNQNKGEKGLGLWAFLHKQRGFIMEISRGDFIKGQKAQGGFKDDVFPKEMHSL